MAEFSPLDFFPEKGQYLPGEPVNVILQGRTEIAREIQFDLRIYRGMDLIEARQEIRQVPTGDFSLLFNCTTVPGVSAGYGVELRIAGSRDLLAETAFDTLADWTDFPRYGFVCDFSPSRTDVEETVQTLAKFHINGLQFYDWQYRHDQLVPPTEEFLDPLGRPLSLSVARSLIKAAHSRGIKAMPYLAIYAASAIFWKSHTDWALYDASHQLIPFGEDFLGIMNPAAGTPWSEHLLEQCREVLGTLPFDGLHIDQYGEPKVGFDASGKPVDLPRAFADFIASASAQHPGKPVLFNAVGNWPIESLAKAPTAFNYIEIWPPDTKYTDLVRIVRNARSLSGGKPVVIALYIPAARATNLRLADAMIYSAGGTHIELGENGRLLSDPYFPRHEAVSEELNAILRRQSDLVARYAEWLRPMVAEDSQIAVRAPEGVKCFPRLVDEGVSLCLVNLSGRGSLEWNVDHEVPPVRSDLEVEIDLPESVSHVYSVSPDEDSIAPQELKFDREGKTTRIHVPRLEIWKVLLIKTTAA